MVDGQHPIDHALGNGLDRLVVAAAVVTHQLEGLVHVDAGACQQDALGLLDQDATVECGLKLLGDQPDWRTARSCSSPIVAMSANAWPSATSSSLRREALTQNRFMAPTTESRRRRGIACADE